MIRKKTITLKTASLKGWSKACMIALLATLIITSCSKDDNQVTLPPSGPYANGFFILNEGWYGHEAGSVNFYGYGADTLQQFAFATANAGSAPTLGSATLEDGAIIGDRLFLVSKVGGPITVADAATLKQVGQITLEGADFRSIAALNEHIAVVSSGSKIYTIDLDALTISQEPVFSGNNIKKLLVKGDYLLASDNQGVDIIKISDWKLAAHFDGPTEGYVSTPDGKVYGAGSDLLISINAATQDTTQIKLSQPIWVNNYTYNPPSLVSSSKENAVFYIATPTSGYGSTTIFKYISGDPNSLKTPFITLPAGETFYNTGLAYDKRNDQIITWSITGYGESDSNFLRFYKASDGALVKTIKYGHIFFPANIIFFP